VAETVQRSKEEREYGEESGWRRRYPEMHHHVGASGPDWLPRDVTGRGPLFLILPSFLSGSLVPSSHTSGCLVLDLRRATRLVPVVAAAYETSPRCLERILGDGILDSSRDIVKNGRN
jgi:hypothetical protein